MKLLQNISLEYNAILSDTILRFQGVVPLSLFGGFNEDAVISDISKIMFLELNEYRKSQLPNKAYFEQIRQYLIEMYDDTYTLEINTDYNSAHIFDNRFTLHMFYDMKRYFRNVFNIRIEYDEDLSDCFWTIYI